MAHIEDHDPMLPEHMRLSEDMELEPFQPNLVSGLQSQKFPRGLEDENESL